MTLRHLAIAACFAMPGAARAQPARVGFSWSAPPGCVAREDILRSLEERLGHPAFSDSGEREVEANGTIEGSEGGLHVRIVLVRTNGEVIGERALDADSCADAADAAVLLVSMLLNVPELVAPPPAPPAPPPPLLPPPPPSRSRWAFDLALCTGVMIGLLPRPSLELTATFGAELEGAVLIGVQVAYDWTDAVSVEGGVLSVNGGSARAIAALPLTFDRLRLAFALSAGPGILWGGAAGFAINRSGSAVWIDLRAGVRFEIVIAGPLSFLLSAEIGALPLLPSFSVGPDGARVVLFRPEPLLGSFGGGLGARFD